MSGEPPKGAHPAIPSLLLDARCSHCPQDVAVRVWSTHAGTSEATWICPACRQGNRLPVIGRARVVAVGPLAPKSVSS